MFRLIAVVALIILQTVVVGPVCADSSGGVNTPPGPPLAPGQTSAAFPVAPVPSSSFNPVVVVPIQNSN